MLQHTHTLTSTSLWKISSPKKAASDPLLILQSALSPATHGQEVTALCHQPPKRAKRRACAAVHSLLEARKFDVALEQRWVWSNGVSTKKEATAFLMNALRMSRPSVGRDESIPIHHQNDSGTSSTHARPTAFLYKVMLAPTNTLRRSARHKNLPLRISLHSLEVSTTLGIKNTHYFFNLRRPRSEAVSIPRGRSRGRRISFFFLLLSIYQDEHIHCHLLSP